MKRRETATVIDDANATSDRQGGPSDGAPGNRDAGAPAARWHVGRMALWAAIILALSAIIILRVFRPAPEVAPTPDEERMAVTVLPVAASRIEDRIELPGKVLAFDDVTMAVEQSGRIVEVMAREGDRVEAGEVVLRIDDRLWITRVRDAEAREREARRNRSRLNELHSEGAVSDRDLDAVETQFETAVIAVEEARIALERCSPTAPVTARVEQRMVSVGEYVAPGQSIYRLLQTDVLKVVFDVPERDIGFVNPDGAYLVRFDALPDREWRAPVRFVAAGANPANNAYRVELEIENPAGAVRVGMMARVDFVRGVIDHAVLLPLDAIVPMDGETVVYVLAQGRASRRLVRIGRIVDDMALIREGVSEGEHVILEGNRRVLDGTPVTVITDWRPASAPGADT